MIYKIDLLLEEKEALAAKDQEIIDLIYMKLLAAYWDFLDIFSKISSDMLLLYRLYDYKIYLESDILLGYSLLYN